MSQTAMAASPLSEIIEHARSLLDAQSAAVCVFDPDNNIVYSNNSHARMLRRGSSEVASDARDIVVDGLTVGSMVVSHDMSEVNRLKRELNRLNQKIRSIQVKYTFRDIIGNDPDLLHIIKIARGAAPTPAAILLRGESGTGKEIFAHAIHNSSDRRYERFVKLNCSSIPDELLESELFGYSEGAFTGARRSGKKGLFFEAHRGTLFLDEIGDVSLRNQVRLLRVLQEKEIMPVGSNKTIPVDVRIICATNRSLEDLVDEKKFRRDLYYRINVFPLYIPPLRKRPGDIEPILTYLLNKYNELYRRDVRDIDPAVIPLLKLRKWEGNVRELENILSRALILMDEDESILTEQHIRMVLENSERAGAKRAGTGEGSDAEDVPELPENLSEALKETERRCILKALLKAGGNKNRAAYELGIPVRTLYYKCNKLGI
ncbi:MAG: sigma 54-interacting transcriptional regulator [Desulfohalobiaceae bacterium]|nr:sigma 54-interacting transcriptional regulator [Desulfohalobiaceae bacterium]